MSLLETSVVVTTLGCLFTISLMASITGLVLVLEQLASAGHLVDPPPDTVALLTLGLAAVDAIVTGTVISILPLATPVAILQPLRLLAPVAGQPDIVPPVAVIAPLVVIPVGKVSAIVMGAVVGPLLTVILIF